MPGRWRMRSRARRCRAIPTCRPASASASTSGARSSIASACSTRRSATATARRTTTACAPRRRAFATSCATTRSSCTRASARLPGARRSWDRATCSCSSSAIPGTSTWSAPTSPPIRCGRSAPPRSRGSGSSLVLPAACCTCSTATAAARCCMRRCSSPGRHGTFATISPLRSTTSGGSRRGRMTVRCAATASSACPARRGASSSAGSAPRSASASSTCTTSPAAATASWRRSGRCPFRTG